VLEARSREKEAMGFLTHGGSCMFCVEMKRFGGIGCWDITLNTTSHVMRVMEFTWSLLGYGVGFKHQTPGGANESRRWVEQIND